MNGLIVVLLIGAVGCSAAAPRPTPTPIPPTPTMPPEGVTVLEPPGQTSNFSLTDQNNRLFQLKDLRGKLVLITFGYTHCPDVCPVNLGRFKQIKMALEAENKAAQVAFVFVSVDGKRDTPAVLAKHLSLFDADFIGLSGDDFHIQQAARDFGVSYTINEKSNADMDYSVTHTAASFMIDQQGLLRRVYSYGTQPDVIVADIQPFLAAQ